MTTPSQKPRIPIKIRPATLLESREIGRIAAETYIDEPLINFLSPYAAQYPTHYLRGFRQRALQRMLDPRNLTFVACDPSDKPIGYTQVKRLGDDAAAQRQIASKKSLWLWVLSWAWAAWCTVVGWVVGGDKSAEPKNVKIFEAWCERDEEIYWGGKAHPERKERWYVQSCVVRAEYQGMGVGKKLMGEVTKRAQEEGVIVGLEASAHGYWMYKSVGFELLARFDQPGLDHKDTGGIMMWSPKKVD